MYAGAPESVLFSPPWSLAFGLVCYVFFVLRDEGRRTGEVDVLGSFDLGLLTHALGVG